MATAVAKANNDDNKDTKDKDTKPQKLEPLICSPQSESSNDGKPSSPNTCYSNPALAKLKSVWNARHPDEAITTNNPTEIWEFLRQQMARVCKNEACWLRKLLITEENGKYRDLLNYTFAPRAPKEWIKSQTPGSPAWTLRM